MGLLARYFLVLWASAMGWPAVSWANPALDSQQLRRLKAGEILVDVQPDPDGASGLVNATIDIAAAPRDLWAIMLDCERSLHIIENLKSCRVLQQSPDGRSDIREHVVEWIWPLPPVRTVFRSNYDPVREIAFQRIDGDLAFMEGYWRLEPLQQGAATRLSYSARITAGWAIPGPLIRSAIETNFPRTLKAIRQAATGRDQ